LDYIRTYPEDDSLRLSYADFIEYNAYKHARIITSNGITLTEDRLMAFRDDLDHAEFIRAQIGMEAYPENSKDRVAREKVQNGILHRHPEWYFPLPVNPEDITPGTGTFKRGFMDSLESRNLNELLHRQRGVFENKHSVITRIEIPVNRQGGYYDEDFTSFCNM